MAELLQLSEATWINLDTITVIKHAAGTVRVWFSDAEQPGVFTAEEATALLAYLHAQRVLAQVKEGEDRMQTSRRDHEK
jgi:hypothetical protein